jgi:tetratricopeptide (TPR) repeat protein
MIVGSLRIVVHQPMALLRRLFAYVVCVAVATPPFAYAQSTPTSSKAATAQPPALAGVTLSGSQQPTYARLLIGWPNGTSLSATAAISSGLALIRLPRPTDVDPLIFARAAPQFVGGAALSTDKRTIRLALVQGVRVASGRDGDTQAFDLILPDAPDPEAFTLSRQQAGVQPTAAQSTPAANAPPKKMINAEAPAGAPRVLVETSVSKEFTRLRLINTVAGASLPGHGFARTGDRMAIAMPGRFALDIASLRSQPPARVLDSARYSSPTDTALVLDVAPGSVVRHSREGNAIIVDILPPGSDPNSVDALLAQAAAKASPPAAPAPAPTAAAGQSASTTSTPPAAPQDTATALTAEVVSAARPDPAPSGRVEVTSSVLGTELILAFGFDAPAPAVIFRRGDSIYALFATKATFDVSKIKTSPAISSIIPIAGEGVSGVRIVAPPQVIANPSALGGIWRLSLGAKKVDAARSIMIERERAADGTDRVKAMVPDGAATGSFIDPVVGDSVLLGLALGPASPLTAPRSFIEASLPETFHGLAVTPRAEDFDLRRSEDGFVLVRPLGMALSSPDEAASAAGLVANAPGFLDHKAWRIGPMADFAKNLDRLRRGAAIESSGPNEGVQKRLDLARFLAAWDLGPEAAGVLAQLKISVPVMDREPEFVALEGIASILMDRGKVGLEKLSQPEVAADPASQLWAGLGAQQSGDSTEAMLRFERGSSALAKFWPQQRALFLLAQAKAALATGQAALAKDFAERARDEATEIPTKLRAQFVVACAQAETGATQDALAGFTKLEGSGDREVASRATFKKAMVGLDSGKVSLPDTIRALDSLRYAWRGDDLEIEVLRRLGSLYITGGDLRSGLTTMTSASSLRTDLPEARLLRDELFKQFKYLFLEGGADGMPPVQALALFYDFKDLAPIGPDGDRMVRGLADRLVSLDLLPQAAQLLQHQVDNRLEGFAKAQVATDLAAIYLMDHRAQDALKTLWGSRVTMLPEALNAQRRLIEAAALAEIGRTEHGLEIIEFDNSPDASRLRAEFYMRAGEWTKAAQNARATLPAVKAIFEPNEAGEVLRAAISTTMANDQDNVRAIVAKYGPAMAKSAYAEAFKVVTDSTIPEPTVLQAAIASVTGGSPYNGLMKRLRTRLTQIPAPGGPEGEPTLTMQVPDGPTDGDPRGFNRDQAPLVPAELPEGIAPAVEATTVAVPATNPVPVAQAPISKAPAQVSRAPQVQRSARAAPVKAKAPTSARPAAPVAAKAPARLNVQAPRDPPPAPVAAR